MVVWRCLLCVRTDMRSLQFRLYTLMYQYLIFVAFTFCRRCAIAIIYMWYILASVMYYLQAHFIIHIVSHSIYTMEFRKNCTNVFFILLLSILHTRIPTYSIHIHTNTHASAHTYARTRTQAQRNETKNVFGGDIKLFIICDHNNNKIFASHVSNVQGMSRNIETSCGWWIQ